MPLLPPFSVPLLPAAPWFTTTVWIPPLPTARYAHLPRLVLTATAAADFSPTCWFSCAPYLWITGSTRRGCWLPPAYLPPAAAGPPSYRSAVPPPFTRVAFVSAAPPLPALLYLYHHMGPDVTAYRVPLQHTFGSWRLRFILPTPNHALPAQRTRSGSFRYTDPVSCLVEGGELVLLR